MATCWDRVGINCISDNGALRDRGIRRRRDALYTQVSHVVSIVVLALRLNATKSAVGISLKTQELYLIVFVARYADLFSHFYS